MQLLLEGSTYRAEILEKILGKGVYGTVVKGNPDRERQTLDCVVEKKLLA